MCKKKPHKTTTSNSWFIISIIKKKNVCTFKCDIKKNPIISGLIFLKSTLVRHFCKCV